MRKSDEELLKELLRENFELLEFNERIFWERTKFSRKTKFLSERNWAFRIFLTKALSNFSKSSHKTKKLSWDQKALISTQKLLISISSTTITQTQWKFSNFLSHHLKISISLSRFVSLTFHNHLIKHLHLMPCCSLLSHSHFCIL